PSRSSNLIFSFFLLPPNFITVNKGVSLVPVLDVRGRFGSPPCINTASKYPGKLVLHAICVTESPALIPPWVLKSLSITTLGSAPFSNNTLNDLDCCREGPIVTVSCYACLSH